MIDYSVHLTHPITQMVKTITKINTHVLKLIHDVSERDICLRRERKGICRGGSRGRGYIHRLHMRLLCSHPLCNPPNKLLAHGTHDMEKRRGRNGDVDMCEDACNS